jgi:hypothetical protein
MKNSADTKAKRLLLDLVAAILLIAAVDLPIQGLMSIFGEGGLNHWLPLGGLEGFLAFLLAPICAFGAFRVFQDRGIGRHKIEFDWSLRLNQKSTRIPLALLFLAGSSLSCTGGFAQLLAEGPHGPDGEITWAPGTPLVALFFVTLGIVLLGLSIRLLANSGPKS